MLTSTKATRVDTYGFRSILQIAIESLSCGSGSIDQTMAEEGGAAAVSVTVPRIARELNGRTRELLR